MKFMSPCKIAPRWMSQDTYDDESILVEVMAWRRKVASHCLSQCWPRFMPWYNVTRPQWANSLCSMSPFVVVFLHPLQWRHNGRDSVSNHQPHDSFLNRLFRHRSKKTSKLRTTGLCAAISPAAGEFPAQMASNAVNVSIWWRHHDPCILLLFSVAWRKSLTVRNLC